MSFRRRRGRKSSYGRGKKRGGHRISKYGSSRGGIRL